MLLFECARECVCVCVRMCVCVRTRALGKWMTVTSMHGVQ